ncbi:MAG: hypothetical protein RLZZ301_641 [Bacteroidota bacterium]|jgi:hypothetical protein
METNTPQPEQKSNGFYFIFIFILLAGLAGMALMWSRQRSALNTCNNNNTQLLADMKDMEAALSGYTGNMSSDLKTDLKQMLSNYNKLIEKDATKADSLNLQKERITQLLKKLEGSKLTARELVKARKENETLRSIMRGWARTIDSLNTLNIDLGSRLEETSARLSTTATERDEFRRQAEESQSQVKKGSKLQAYGFRSEALRQKVNNLMEVTDRAKNAVQLRSSFTLSENVLATSGKKTVYMQLIGPDGQTLQASSNYVLETDGGSIAYSQRKDIDYQNQAVDLTIYYEMKGEEAARGTYKVRIYCDGQLIGTDSFNLK